MNNMFDSTLLAEKNAQVNDTLNQTQTAMIDHDPVPRNQHSRLSHQNPIGNH